MSRKRLFATTVGTIGCALGIGFFMQQGNTPATGQQVVAPQIAPEPVEQLVLNTVVEPKLSDIAPPDSSSEIETPAPIEAEPEIELDEIKLTSIDVTPVLATITSSLMETASLDDVAKPGDSFDTPSDPRTPYLGCDVRVNAQALDMGNVRLSINAPCNGNERVTIHHTGMMFTKVTTDDGRAEAIVPAFSETAIFIVEIENGEGAVETVTVDDLAGLERIALQWSGFGGFQIHAREFGAAYGTSGHVWSGSSLGSGAGQLVRLGDAEGLNPNIVEIYTFPTAQSTRDGTVALSIEAEVTDANCGRDIAAQSIELRAPGAIRTRDLVLTMPECSAVGDFLVLNNLVDDLKIASR
ncbi:MAG: hypothetical protein AB3N13_06070 [Arenibacterium sp.]